MFNLMLIVCKCRSKNNKLAFMMRVITIRKCILSTLVLSFFALAVCLLYLEILNEEFEKVNNLIKKIELM